MLIRWKQPHIGARPGGYLLLAALAKDEGDGCRSEHRRRGCSPLDLGWAGISFTLLSLNAAEPAGRSQFRGVVVYGRTRASEQEFIT